MVIDTDLPGVTETPRPVTYATEIPLAPVSEKPTPKDVSPNRRRLCYEQDFTGTNRASVRMHHPLPPGIQTPRLLRCPGRLRAAHLAATIGVRSIAQLTRSAEVEPTGSPLAATSLAAAPRPSVHRIQVLRACHQH